jgi:deazaflavin-dependent oxidoreductase (nitroreductase family)
LYRGQAAADRSRFWGFGGSQGVWRWRFSGCRCCCTARAGAGCWGDTFLLLVHEGRKTGKRYSTVAMVLRYEPRTREAVICSAWGQGADWICNIRARPALRVQIGRASFTPQQRFLSPDESLAVLAGFRHRHPQRSRLLTSVLGWGDLGSDAAAREFVHARPFVSLRPLGAGHQRVGGEGDE